MNPYTTKLILYAIVSIILLDFHQVQFYVFNFPSAVVNFMKTLKFIPTYYIGIIKMYLVRENITETYINI